MGAFHGCRNLKEVVIEGECSSIGVEAFKGCVGLRKFSAKQGIQKIGYAAFHGCILLESLEGIDRVEKLGAMSFYGCVKLGPVLTFNSCRSIEEGSFLECEDLVCLRIPGSCEFTISDGASYASYDVMHVDPGCTVERIEETFSKFMNPPFERLVECKAFGEMG